MTGEWIMLVLLALALFVIGGTILPLFSHDHWGVRFFDFPRVQLTVVAFITLGGLIGMGPSSVVEYVVTICLLLCLLFQITRIIPYSPLAPLQVRPAESEDEAERISLLVCNVELENRSDEAVLDLVKRTDPDLVLAVETDEWWTEHLRPLEETYPHIVEHPQDNAYGMVLYSKNPLLDAEVRFLVDKDVPSIHARVSRSSGPPVYIHGVHPRPPHPTNDPDTTERDAELLHLARKIRDREAPTIVVGDLNDVSWSYTTRLFQKISGLLDPRIGRGTYSTFHARYPLFRYPLDHTFHSSHFKLVALEVLPYVGSDHFPVYVELQYEAQAPDDHEEPTADAQDEAQAQHELNKLQAKRGRRTLPGILDEESGSSSDDE